MTRVTWLTINNPVFVHLWHSIGCLYVLSNDMEIREQRWKSVPWSHTLFVRCCPVRNSSSPL